MHAFLFANHHSAKLDSPRQSFGQILLTMLSQFSVPRYLRLPLVAVAIVACLFVIQSTAKYGLSQLLITYSLTSGNLTAASTAIRLAPRDAEAHFANGAVLSLSGKPDQALLELERAVSLRPSDYGLWSELGLMRDQLGDAEGALRAFNESIRLAPHYSKPKWNRGNVLLRAGQYEAGFNDLNDAADSNPELLPTLMSLSWSVSKGDLQLAEQLAEVNSDERRLALARFFAWQGNGQLAISQYAKVANVPEEIKRAMIDQLLAKGAAREAYLIWKGTVGSQPSTEIYDGGFEAPLSLRERSFGWVVASGLQTATVSLDSSNPHSGARDVRVDFNGNSDPGVSLLSQVLPVEPSRRYQVNFASRSEAVVTGGLPVVIVVDNSRGAKRLGLSTPVAKGTSGWQVNSFEFTTTPETNTVTLTVTRENCAAPPCPIFGAVSFDSFSIQPLK